MASRFGGSSRPSVAIAFVVLAAVLALAAWLRPATAQDGTPEGASMASPTTMGTADCAEVLGIGLPGDSCIRVIHASPDADPIAVFVDEQNAVTSLAFGRATPAYTALPAGEHRIRVALAAEGIDAAVIDETVTLAPGQAYEIAAIGLVDSLEALITPVNLDPLSAGTSRLRVIQAVPDAPAADVAVVGGDVVLSGITFGSPTDYVEVPVAETAVDLEVRPEGVPAGVPLPAVSIAPGLVYSVYPVGQIAEPWTLAVLVVAAPASGLGAGTPVPGPTTVNLEVGTPPPTPEA